MSYGEGQVIKLNDKKGNITLYPIECHISYRHRLVPLFRFKIVAIHSLIRNTSRYGIILVLPSTEFIECPTVIRNASESSRNFNIKDVWAETSYITRLQYDQFQNTKQVLKSIQQDQEKRINNSLLTQGLVVSSVIKQSRQNFKGL